jgi:hypothetical protein
MRWWSLAVAVAVLPSCTLDSSIVPFGGAGGAGGSGATGLGGAGASTQGGGGAGASGLGGAGASGLGGAGAAGGGASGGGGSGGVGGLGGGGTGGVGGSGGLGGGGAMGGGGSGGSPTEGACDTCMLTHCAAFLTICQLDANCTSCLEAMAWKAPNDCTVNTPWLDVDTCTKANCGSECPQNYCNPVTNQGCTAAERCDLAAWNGKNFYRCYGGNNTLGCGAVCENAGGATCAGGYACADPDTPNKCRAWCCTDADCDPDGYCFNETPTTAGICQPLVVSADLCNAEPPSPTGSCVTWDPQL